MNDQAPLDSFTGKWRERWPEWELAGVFLDGAQRERAAAWLALLHELRDAAWAGAGAAPGLAKLAWWQEELRGWAKGARRHPLGQALQKLDAPWDGLGLALAELPATRAPDSEEADARALARFATALLACESALFGAPPPRGDEVQATVAALRAERAWVQGDDDAVRDCLGTITLAPGLSRVRRLQHAVVRLRAEAPGTGRVRPLRLLWAAWRAARGR